MTPPPHDAFWTRVAHSGLVDAETLAALRHAHDATVPATDLGSVPAIAQWLVRRGTLTRWQARRLAADEPGPFFLGDYRLLDRRDRRGDGLLFKARHDPSGRDVNLMLLNAKLCRNVEVWTEIVRRTTAAHQATHPFLTRTWALEQVAGSRFIVCEAVPGRPLAEELERLGPLPPREAATVVARACRAVAALHAAGVVHGAISLDTLIRTTAPRDAAERTGRIRLLQYPLVGDPHAVALRPAIGTDEEVAALGSRAAFVAPELLLPDQQCDQRSDVYALGCLLHALLVGRAPGWHGDPQATLKKAAFSGLEPIGPEAGVPEEIATLVSYMTTRDPEARYQTAADAAEAIAACCGLTADDEADPEPDPGPPVGATAAQDDPRAGEARDFPVAAGAATGPAADPAADQAWPTGLDVGAATAARAGSAGTKLPTARMRRLQFAALAVPALILLVGAAIVGPQLLGPGADRGTQVARTEKPPRTRPTGDPDSRTPPIVRPPDGVPPSQPGPSPRPGPADADPANAPQPAPAVRQTVVDHDALPWASPTVGPPPTLAYLPPGAQLVLLARPAAIAAEEEGRLFLKSLGPTVAAAAAAAGTLCGTPWEGIESLQAGWLAGGGADELLGGYAIRLAPGRSLPADDAARTAAWGKTEPLTIEGQGVFKGPRLCFWIPAADAGRTLVAAPEPVLRSIIGEWQANRDAAGPAVSLPRDTETLVGMLDATRHVSLFGSPHHLVHDGRGMLAGPLAKLVGPLGMFFGDAVRAAALSLHFGDAVYMELDAVATAERPAVKLAPQFLAALGRLPDAVEEYCTALAPDPYGRKLVLRLPAMLRILAANLRAGAEGRGAVINAYLPRHAAHNMALAAELALAQEPRAAAPAGGDPVAAGGAAARLQTRMTLVFAKETLEKSIQLIAEEIGVPMEIRGTDLQLEGITKNQSFALEERDRPAEDILRAILAKADPAGRLVYVVRRQGDSESIDITTKAAATSRGEKGTP
jgi:serine/threonine-protein kinase